MNKKILFILILFFVVLGATQALATLTFTSNAITGTTASTIDLGSGNALSLQTTGNGAITTGSGLFTAGGSLSVTGNVGIGTTTPLLKLDVAGSGRFTGTATSVLTGSIDATASTAVVGVGTLFTTELVVGDRITVTGETRTVTAITDNTNLTVDTAFTDTANDTTPDKLAAELIVRDSSNNVDFIVQDSGNVGIGTTRPDSFLQISKLYNGGATFLHINNQSDWGQTGDIIFSYHPTVITLGKITTEYRATNSGRISFFPATSGVFNSVALMGIEGGSTYGVGIGAPANPGGLLEITASNTYGTARDLFLLSSDNTKDGDRLIVKNDGSVGIGTATPGALLDVQGSVNLEKGTGSVSTNAVTISKTSGVITDSTDINLDTTRAAITLTNTRIASASVVAASICSTPDAGARLGVAVTPGNGSATITVYNSGTANQTSDYTICFIVTN